MTNLLWMEEDELRQVCYLLMASLAHSQERQACLLEMVDRAAADGYRMGYADASADRALRVTQEVAVGDEEGLVLH